MISRRGFLAAIAAGLTLDPERALWVPGKKLISIPKPRAAGDLVNEALRLVGVLPTGGRLSDKEMELALFQVNGMLDRWSREVQARSLYEEALRYHLAVRLAPEFGVGLPW